MPPLQRAIELNPSNAQAKAAFGTALIGQKRYSEGVEFLEGARLINLQLDRAATADILGSSGADALSEWLTP